MVDVIVNPLVRTFAGVRFYARKWTPASLPSLFAWLDPESGITVSDASVPSEDISTWDQLATATTGGHSDPDGGSAAYLVAADGSSANHYARTFASNMSLTHVVFQCWLRAGSNLTNDIAVLRCGLDRAHFNLATGTVDSVSGATARVVESRGDWHLCEMTTEDPSNNQLDIFPRTVTSYAGSDDVYAYAPEVTQPKISPNLTTWTATALDITALSDMYWYRLTLTGGSTSHRVEQDATDCVVDRSIVLTWDVDTTTSTHQWWRVLLDGVDSVWFDASNGVVGTDEVGTATVTDLGAGISRFTVTFSGSTDPVGIRFQATAVDAGGFSPDADGEFADIGNVAAIQQRVSAWADQEGSLDLVQATAENQPLYVSDVTPPVLRFDAADDELPTTLASSAYTFLHDGTGGTVAAVVEPADVSSTNYYVWDFLAFGSEGFRLIQVGGQWRCEVGNASGSALARCLSSAVTAVAGQRCIIVFRVGSTQARAYLEDENGVIESLSDAFAGSPSAAATANPLTIGRDSTLAPAAADIGEVLVFDSELSDFQVDQVVDYLKDRWF